MAIYMTIDTDQKSRTPFSTILQNSTLLPLDNLDCKVLYKD